MGQQLCAKNVKNTEACVRVSVFVDETKKSNEKRKKRASSDKASERAKTAGMEKRRPPHSLFRVLTRFFALFFDPFSPLSWSLEQAKNTATHTI